jgi:hypothetical protein
MLRKHRPSIVAWHRPQRQHVSHVRLWVNWTITSAGCGMNDVENTSSSTVACWTVFTELLSGKALIKSVTILQYLAHLSFNLLCCLSHLYIFLIQISIHSHSHSVSKTLKMSSFLQILNYSRNLDSWISEKFRYFVNFRKLPNCIHLWLYSTLNTGGLICSYMHGALNMVGDCSWSHGELWLNKTARSDWTCPWISGAETGSPRYGRTYVTQ